MYSLTKETFRRESGVSRNIPIYCTSITVSKSKTYFSNFQIIHIFKLFSCDFIVSILSIIEFKKKMLFSKSKIHYFLICRLTFSPSKNLKHDIPYFLIIFIRTIIKHFCQNSQSGILLTRKRDELGINFGLR